VIGSCIGYTSYSTSSKKKPTVLPRDLSRTLPMYGILRELNRLKASKSSLTPLSANARRLQQDQQKPSAQRGLVERKRERSPGVVNKIEWNYRHLPCGVSFAFLLYNVSKALLHPQKCACRTNFLESFYHHECCVSPSADIAGGDRSFGEWPLSPWGDLES
jgi:hypothetical protein